MDTRSENTSSSDTPSQQGLKTPRLRRQFSNVIFNASTFTEVGGDFNHYHVVESSETGLHLLRKAASLGAMHDSSERFPVKTCEPGTREGTLKSILDWIKDPDPSSSIFWLYGAPDEGTTAVLQSIAESCASSEELKTYFGGSFFFSKEAAGRDKGHHLFLTIAYQLALNVPVLRDPINHIICANPALPTKSISVQLESLIVCAFQSLESHSHLSLTVIIDGLDECQDNDTQLLILRLIADLITEQKAPLRFLIGSRPEPHICGAFDEPILYSITQSVFLAEAYDRKRRTRQQNGKRLSSDDPTKIGERFNDMIPDPKNKDKVMVSKRLLAVLEQNLDALKLIQAQLIEENRALKAENEISERKLKARDERIQNLEALLKDADNRLSQQNNRFEGCLQVLRERLDKARAERTERAQTVRPHCKSSEQNKSNGSSPALSEDPSKGKGPDLANRHTSWFFAPLLTEPSRAASSASMAQPMAEHPEPAGC